MPRSTGRSTDPGRQASKPTHARSWRQAKRLEDNTSPPPVRKPDVESDLAGRRVEGSADLLAAAQDAFELDDADMASLFGVAAPAMEEWRRRGVPGSHGERLELIHETASRLRSHGRERTVAQLARVAVPEAGGGCVLDLLAEEDIDPVALEDTVAAVTARASRRALYARGEAVTVRDVMEPQVVAVDGDDPVREAARRMRAADIGDVVVIDRGGLAGVLTDRDIVVRVVAAQRDPAVTTARQVASREVVSAPPEMPVEEAVQLMRARGLRRLPVVEDGTLVGVVSLADLAVDLDPESVLAAIAGAPAS